MGLDLVALALLLYMTFAGFRRGALVSFLRIFSLCVAYAASFFLGPLLAPRASRMFVVPDMVALGIAGTAVFFGVLLVLGGVTAFVRRSQRHRDVDHPRPLADRAVG